MKNIIWMLIGLLILAICTIAIIRKVESEVIKTKQFMQEHEIKIPQESQ